MHIRTYIHTHTCIHTYTVDINPQQALLLRIHLRTYMHTYIHSRLKPTACPFAIHAYTRIRRNRRQLHCRSFYFHKCRKCKHMHACMHVFRMELKAASKLQRAYVCMYVGMYVCMYTNIYKYKNPTKSTSTSLFTTNCVGSAFGY